MNFEKRIFIFLLFVFCICTCTQRKLLIKEIAVEREGRTIAVIKTEIAVSDEERSQGLMYRKKLPDGEGMLFVYDKDQVMSFWMKNTNIPLSIAFIAYDGKIIEIKDMYPHDETSVLSSRSVRYALEVPQGWFLRAGIIPGDVINMADIK
jgi:uncharacterized membrane protein (UPF0127 family)